MSNPVQSPPVQGALSQMGLPPPPAFGLNTQGSGKGPKLRGGQLAQPGLGASFLGGIGGGDSGGSGKTLLGQ